MKTYEAMILLDNREVKKGWQTLKEQVDAVLSKEGAEIVVAKRWDERKLAYEIKKQRRATYYLTYFKADPESISTINRSLALTAPVLRSLVLACDEIPAEAYEPERDFEIDRPDDEAVEEEVKDQAPKDEAPKDQAPKDQAPEDQGPEDEATGAEATGDSADADAAPDASAPTDDTRETED